jgi:hypothetical protein
MKKQLRRIYERLHDLHEKKRRIIDICTSGDLACTARSEKNRAYDADHLVGTGDQRRRNPPDSCAAAHAPIVPGCSMRLIEPSVKICANNQIL